MILWLKGAAYLGLFESYLTKCPLCSDVGNMLFDGVVERWRDCAQARYHVGLSH